MSLEGIINYQTATVWISNNTKNNIGAYENTYKQVGTVNISRVEPMQGTGFNLVDRGEIITGFYKVYSLEIVSIGKYIYINNGFYRVVNCSSWNNQYFEFQIELLPGVCPNG